mmetsp:Transcript_11790/g.25112  ORF Transcript_11790/g.25112 Transcript_11790/m.25112 type:complete len:310 (+) Transcript_11790:1986-2915(+)
MASLISNTDSSGTSSNSVTISRATWTGSSLTRSKSNSIVVRPSSGRVRARFMESLGYGFTPPSMTSSWGTTDTLYCTKERLPKLLVSASLMLRGINGGFMEAATTAGGGVLEREITSISCAGGSNDRGSSSSSSKVVPRPIRTVTFFMLASFSGISPKWSSEVSSSFISVDGFLGTGAAFFSFPVNFTPCGSFGLSELPAPRGGISCPSIEDAYFVSIFFDPFDDAVSEKVMLFIAASSITMSSTAGSTSIASSSFDFLAKNLCSNNSVADGRALASSPIPKHNIMKFRASCDLTLRKLRGGMPCVTFL